MELRIHFTEMPAGMELSDMRAELDQILEENGWLTGSGQESAGGHVELELEDERLNPKYGIMAVKNYLQKKKFSPDTTIELCGVPVGIYE